MPDSQCHECDGNGCIECQPDVWFACPNHPEIKEQSNGWVPCSICGADMTLITGHEEHPEWSVDKSGNLI